MKRIPLGPKGDTRRIYFNVVEDLGYLDPDISLPPLYMQYNPQTCSLNYKKITTRYQTFAAHVEEYWGDELDTLSANATTGGFVLDDITSIGGYNTYHRKSTAPYHKFQDLVDIYNNNGNTYDNQGRIIKKGSILLFFDPGTYLGYFENFNYTEDAEKPYVFNFDFVFKVTKSFTGF